MKFKENNKNLFFLSIYKKTLKKSIIKKTILAKKWH